MERLSILVPLMGDLKRFEDTLVSVLENRPERSSVVVVTTAPYDDPYSLRGEVTFVEAPAGAGLLRCLAAGLSVSRGPLVHLLAPGVEASPGWTDAALAQFRDPNVAAVAPLVVDRDRPETILSAGLRYASSGSIERLAAGKRLADFVPDEGRFCGPELIAAFYRRDALAATGALADDGCPWAAAIELDLALQRAGHRLVQEPHSLTSAALDAFKTPGAWREGLRASGFIAAAAPRAEAGYRALAHAAMVAIEVVQAPLRPTMLARLAGEICARLAPQAMAEVSLGDSDAQQAPASLLCPVRYVAPESRAA